jgi:putative ABC transport system permease protein
LYFNSNRGKVHVDIQQERSTVGIRALFSRFLELFRRRRRDELLSEEIQSHLDHLTDELVARGLPRREAQRAARREFGNVALVTDAYRDQRGLPVLDALAQDVRFALRLLRRDRGFATTAILVLGVGIGVNNMLFTILNAHTIRGLPIPRVDRVISVSSFDDRAPDRGLSHLDFDELRAAVQDVATLAAFASAPVVVAGEDRAADRFEGAFATWNAFAVVGVEPVLGRAFAAADDRPGAERVAIVGSGAWASRWGSDRGVLGRSILVNGAPTTVIGVMPERSGFPATAEIWLPLAQMSGLSAQPRDARTLRVFGRLVEGVTVAEARSSIEAVVERSSRDYPDTNRNLRARVMPINERFLGRLGEPAWVAFMTVGCLVVLISCANVANLLLASSVRRGREIAIRSSLGASRRRVIRQMLIESAVLAAAGGSLGLLLGAAGVRLFGSAIPANTLPYWFDYSLDARVLGALVTVSAVSVFVFGLMPAFYASRTDVASVLKDGGSAGSSRRGAQRWSTAFLAAEFGLAVVLLAQIAVTLRSNGPGLPSDDALDSTQVLTAVLTLTPDAYPSPEQRIEFHRRLRERLLGNPALSAVSLASVLPLQGGPETRMDVDGRPQPDGQPALVRTVLIEPRFFEALGLPLKAGRDFTDEDGAPGRGSAIVNERLAERFFPGENPIGQRISTAAPGPSRSWLTIVGIAPDIRYRAGADAAPIAYVPQRAESPATMTLLVRSRDDAGDLAPSLRREVQALDAALPLYRIRTLSQAARDAQWNGRLSSRLIQALTLIAVALATVGLYAVTAYSVSQRTQEIGVRVALGARPRQVAGMVAKRVLVQLAVGFVAGVGCTLAWDRVFGGGNPTSRASDPASLAMVAAALLVVAAIASLVPIRRAVRLDPLAALRSE